MTVTVSGNQNCYGNNFTILHLLFQRIFQHNGDMKRKLYHIQPGQRFSGKIEMIQNNTAEIWMYEDSVIRIEGCHCGVKIFCIKGLLWITQENDIQDHFLKAGEEFQISHLGLVIVQALTDCCNFFCEHP